jgi:predicted PhzF superfamily epimerase YddE/YHI9
VGVKSILYTGEQGVALGKPGYVFVKVAIDRGRLKNVTIGGFAVSAGERILRL